jgi:predicted TIM-barrel fold metal-dependent hydrolase
MIWRNARVGNHSLCPRPSYRLLWRAVLALAVSAAASCDPSPAPAPDKAAPTLGYDPEIIKVDVHMHVAPEAAETALAVMYEAHIAVGLNASGGTPEQGLAESVAIARRSGGRLLPLCNIDLSRVVTPEFSGYVERTLNTCKSVGGLGVKIPKSLGLGVQDAAGNLLAVDDPRFDPIFAQAGALGLPVLIHSGDPKAFFQPATPANERYAELRAHPGWSFYGLAPNGSVWPSWEDLLAQFERRVARHPGTKFLGAHFGNAAEDPTRVARMLARYPNLFIDTAARVPEFGRHPAPQMRAFFLQNQDRVLFGSDLGVMRHGVILGSSGAMPDALSDAPRFFRAHYQYFESNRARLAHPTPIQGTWTVDGVGLPREVLDKLYYRNAVRLFSLHLPEQPSSRGN